MKVTKKWFIPNLTIEESLQLFGPNDMYLNLAEKIFNVSLSVRDGHLMISGPSHLKAEEVINLFQLLLEDLRKGKSIDERDVRYLALSLKREDKEEFKAAKEQPLGRTFSGRLIFPKTIGQSRLVQAMKDYDILFVIGPAGTGKTYLSVVYACNLLKNGDVKKIILTRPAVEAGESLGFLPGDLKEKVDPYLQPLYDALNDCLGFEQYNRLMEKGVIEVVPLAYMRGRTLDDAYIILDEAQNTTGSQMKMFLTRLGVKSKMVVNGDITQIDLKNVPSGLVRAREILSEIKEIGFVELSGQDVVRHPLVQKIIDAYSNRE